MVRKPIAILAIALLCALTFAHSYDEHNHDYSVVKTSYKPKCDSLKKHHKYEKEEHEYEKEEDKYEKEEHKYEEEEDKHEKKEEYKYEKKDDKKKVVYGKKCMFKFCDGKRVVYVGKNDKALTSAICSKKYGVKIGSVDETGEAYLVHYKRIRISKWKPYGLKQSFAPSFFKAYTKHGKNASGVGHEVAQQNQAKFLNKKCWILPLKAYQVWDKKTGGWVEKYGKDPYVDCISFCTLIKKPYY